MEQIKNSAQGEGGIVYELEQYRQKKFNLLVPDIAIGGLSVFHKPVVDKVTLSPNPKDGDVYSDSNAGGLVISGKGLAKLATTAGIVWDLSRCRRTDDRSDPNYCAYRAVGGLRKPDGAIVWADASYDIDFDVLHAQLVEKYSAKAAKSKKDQGWIDYCVNRDFQQKMTHKLKLCETGAKNRVIRKLLGIRSTYTPDELSRPFVMPRIILRPDYNDPVVKEKMLNAAIQAQFGLYGPPASAPDVDSSLDSHPPQNDDPVDVDPDSPAAEDQIMENASRREDFLNADRNTRIHTLKELAKRKAYDLGALKRPMDGWEDKYLVEFYDTLMGMPDATDDRPFA